MGEIRPSAAAAVDALLSVVDRTMSPTTKFGITNETGTKRLTKYAASHFCHNKNIKGKQAAQASATTTCSPVVDASV